MKPRSKQLLNHLGDTIRLKGYSIRAEKTCADWIKRFIRFHDKRHPQEMSHSGI